MRGFVQLGRTFLDPLETAVVYTYKKKTLSQETWCDKEFEAHVTGCRRKKSEGHQGQLLTCVHLPDVDRAVGAAHHQVVVGRTPLDDLDGEEVARGQHDALPLPEAEQAHRVVAGHGADAMLHPGLQGAVEGAGDEEKKGRNESSHFVS